MPRRALPTGEVFYRGGSIIDDVCVFAVATLGPSRNAKTGANVIQTWIMREDTPPHVAVKTGEDQTVCGECRLRPLLAKSQPQRKCYVRHGDAPLSVWKTYHALKYSVDPLRLPFGSILRAGSYGDPAVIPFDAWDALRKRLRPQRPRNVVGYTQLWRVCDQRFREMLMASVHDEHEAADAWSRGWRTYRVLHGEEEPSSNEVRCPASKEEDHRLTCEQCRACYGSMIDREVQPASITIREH